MRTKKSIRDAVKTFRIDDGPKKRNVYVHQFKFGLTTFEKHYARNTVYGYRNGEIHLLLGEAQNKKEFIDLLYNHINSI